MTEQTITIMNLKSSADDKRHEIKFRDSKHVPFNKRRYDVNECIGIMEVVDYDGSLSSNPSAWTAITLTEVETYASGRTQERNISFTLHDDMRTALLGLLSRSSAHSIEIKANKLDHAFRTERDHMRRAGTNVTISNMLNDVVQNWPASRKARLYDLIQAHDTPLSAFEALDNEKELLETYGG